MPIKTIANTILTRMIYTEFAPTLSLAPYIETYWTACGYTLQEEPHRVLPDGCVDIIFSLNSSSHCDLLPYVPNIVGTITTFLERSYISEVYMVGIRFRPTGFTAFCPVPINEFTDKRVDLTLVDSLFDKRFYADLPEKKTPADVIRHIDTYFLQKLKQIYLPEKQIQYATELIRQSQGMLPLNELAYRSCLSLRHFERKFKAAVGISPKTFGKIAKFQHTCHYLSANPESSLFTVAVDCGYYDKAHLIKDFKALSGDSPSSFR